MRSKSQARILQRKILVRNPKIHGRIFGSMFSAMQKQKSQNITKKISARCGVKAKRDMYISRFVFRLICDISSERLFLLWLGLFFQFECAGRDCDSHVEFCEPM
jgi:hypothetical protein